MLQEASSAVWRNGKVHAAGAQPALSLWRSCRTLVQTDAVALSFFGLQPAVLALCGRRTACVSRLPQQHRAHGQTLR